MSKDKPKITRTARHLMGGDFVDGLDGSVRLPVGTPDNNFVPRLSLVSSGAAQPCDWDAVTQAVADAPDVLFVCDTSLFDDRTPEAIWDALRAEAFRFATSPRVMRELKGWSERRPDHPASRLLHSDSVVTLGEDLHGWRGHAYTYYVALLGVRRRADRLARAHLESSAGGRPVSEDDVRTEVQRRVGPRGYALTKKISGKSDPATLFTDEELVYVAVEHAVLTGQETVILTKDEDLYEQLYKLQWLIATHYRGHLLATAVADGMELEVVEPPDTPDMAECFERAALWRRPPGCDELVLPSSFSFVPVSCWVLGERMSTFTFGAEQEMGGLLRTKGSTEGRNTDRHGDGNVHYWLGPLDVPEDVRNCAVLGLDRRSPVHPSSSAHIALLDARQALFVGERFLQLEADGPS